MQAQGLAAYSLPAASVASGAQVIFDRNATQAGTAVSHTQNTAPFTISQTGTYFVHYAATITPTSSTFPVSNLTNFTINGQTQSAGTSQIVFSANSPQRTVASLLFNVTSVPATLAVVSSGGTFLYSDASLNVFRVGDSSS